MSVWRPWRLVRLSVTGPKNWLSHARVSHCLHHHSPKNLPFWALCYSLKGSTVGSNRGFDIHFFFGSDCNFSQPQWLWASDCGYKCQFFILSEAWKSKFTLVVLGRVSPSACQTWWAWCLVRFLLRRLWIPLRKCFWFEAPSEASTFWKLFAILKASEALSDTDLRSSELIITGQMLILQRGERCKILGYI